MFFFGSDWEMCRFTLYCIQNNIPAKIHAVHTGGCANSIASIHFAILPKFYQNGGIDSNHAFECVLLITRLSSFQRRNMKNSRYIRVAKWLAVPFAQ